MKLIFIVSVFVLLLPALALSQTNDTKESLRGLRGVFINVLSIAADAQADGLSTSQIQKTVESELRKAGVSIQNESKFGQEYAVLGINVDTGKLPNGFYVFTVRLSVVQRVQLPRPQVQGTFPAETYGSRALGITPQNRMDLIYEPLKDKLAEFIRDYLSVNKLVKRIETPKAKT